MKSFLTIAAIAAFGVAGMAAAAPGDLHRINADLVNLRAGPTDNASIRDRLEGGTEVIELRSDGGWYGIRVVETGQEGWIYGRLLDRVASSELSEIREEHGFRSLSADFDHLIGELNGQLGLSMVETVTASGDRLVVAPSPAWLRVSSLDAQLLASASIYQIWKNHQNQAPVSVVLLDGQGADYVVIEDLGEGGPAIRVIDRASGTETRG
ncbi:MAG: SH3 domain-containing protein [Paracoccaceae bacterium]